MTNTDTKLPIPFVFFESYTRALMRIPEEAREQRAELALAIVEYGALGIEPDFGTNWPLASAFDLARPNLDSSVKNYLNGKKGGRPRKSASPEPAVADAEMDEEERKAIRKMTRAMATCYESVPDDVLEAQAAYMSDEHERELEALRAMTDAEDWIG